MMTINLMRIFFVALITGASIAHAADVDVDARLIVDESELACARQKIIATAEGGFDPFPSIVAAAKEFKPLGIIDYQGREFYLGNPVEIPPYKLMVMYFKDSGDLLYDSYSRILVHLSTSSGAWQANPGVLCERGLGNQKDKLSLSKGIYHYTQETKIVVPIAQKITELYDSIPTDTVRKLSTDFLNDFEIDINHYGYRDHINEVRVFLDDNIINERNYAPGILFREKPKNAREQGLTASTFLQQIKVSAALPQFNSAPMNIYNFTHPIIGEVIVEIYHGQNLDGRIIEWHMATDAKTRNKIWIDRIAFKECAVNQYGCCKEVIQSGIMTSNPIDYIAQTSWLDDSEVITLEQATYASIYRDITPVLRGLSPIKNYAEKNRRRLGVMTDTLRAVLESKLVGELSHLITRSGHLTQFPSSAIPVDKKLVIGIFRDKKEHLYVVEEDHHVTEAIGNLDRPNYYFMKTSHWKP